MKNFSPIVLLLFVVLFTYSTEMNAASASPHCNPQLEALAFQANEYAKANDPIYLSGLKLKLHIDEFKRRAVSLIEDLENFGSVKEAENILRDLNDYLKDARQLSSEWSDYEASTGQNLSSGYSQNKLLEKPFDPATFITVQNWGATLQKSLKLRRWLLEVVNHLGSSRAALKNQLSFRLEKHLSLIKNTKGADPFPHAEALFGRDGGSGGGGDF